MGNAGAGGRDPGLRGLSGPAGPRTPEGPLSGCRTLGLHRAVGDAFWHGGHGRVHDSHRSLGAGANHEWRQLAGAQRRDHHESSGGRGPGRQHRGCDLLQRGHGHRSGRTHNGRKPQRRLRRRGRPPGRGGDAGPHCDHRGRHDGGRPRGPGDLLGRHLCQGHAGPEVSLASVAALAYLTPHKLPAGLPPGLEITSRFTTEGVTWSNATHACTCEVDPATGGSPCSVTSSAKIAAS